MSPFFAWVEPTGVATTVRPPLLLTGGLSAVHLLGFRLVTGGALVANLRLLGCAVSTTAGRRRHDSSRAGQNVSVSSRPADNGCGRFIALAGRRLAGCALILLE